MSYATLDIALPQQPAGGFLDVLNVGHGHLSFKFDKGSAEESEKAKKVITDMLRRGYMLFVKIDGEQKRVRKFDPETSEYIVEEPDDEVEIVETPPVARRGRTAGSSRHSMRHSRATAIGPTAGG